MPYHIQTFDRSAPAYGEFEQFGIEHYRGDQFFRPPSPPPESARCFLVRSGDVVCGRAAVTINPGIALNGEPTALIGWYECVDDPAASKALFDAATEYCRTIGIRQIIGPMNGDTWHSYRAVVPPSASPFFPDEHHKPWYWNQFEGEGFQPIASYHSSHILLNPERAEEQAERISQFLKRFGERHIRVRAINPEEFEEDLKKIYEISVEAFRENFLYTPISEEEFIRMYRPLLLIVDPNFVLLAESKDGEPLSFAFGVKNLYAAGANSLVIKTVATKRRPETLGLGIFLTVMLHHRAWEAGYREVIHALMHEGNSSANVLRDESELIRLYRLYSKRV